METIITALGILIGLFLTVGTPIIKLNSTITKLNANLETLKDRTDKQDTELKYMKEHAHESHCRLWAHNTEQDEKLADHDKRIEVLEKTK